MLIECDVILTYINSVDMEIEFSVNNDYVALKGEEIVNNNIYTQKRSGVDGEFVTGSSLDPRNIVLTGYVKNLDIQYAKRELEKVFNPTITGVLHYHNQIKNKKRYIECRVREIPAIYWDKGRLLFDVQLIAHGTFWLADDVTEILALVNKMWKFPFSIPNTTAGFVFGRRVERLKTIFDNKGDVATGFSAIFRANGGSVVNPYIFNALTGDRIAINYNMKKNDIIQVINYSQDKRVLINGIENAKIIDFESSNFESFKVLTGMNEFGYNAENVSNLIVTISYTPLYTGV